MDDPSSRARARGDVGELFRSFNPLLLRSVADAVPAATPEVIEDACAHAWAAFIDQQPDRTDDWRDWLLRTAERHARALERSRREAEPIDPEAIGGLRDGEADLSVRDDVNEVLSVIAALPPRLQRVAVLRAMGFTHSEISTLVGLSTGRVHALASRASRRIAGLLDERERATQPALPRTERLRQLEDDPPDWLVAKIGPPVVKAGHASERSVLWLAWRRAAIALDDYRQKLPASRASRRWRSSARLIPRYAAYTRRRSEPWRPTSSNAAAGASGKGD